MSDLRRATPEMIAAGAEVLFQEFWDGDVTHHEWTEVAARAFAAMMAAVPPSGHHFGMAPDHVHIGAHSHTTTGADGSFSCGGLTVFPKR